MSENSAECSSDVFWANDLSILFKCLTFIPSETMTINQKLNALTRLAILITIALFLFQKQLGKKWWLLFFMGSIALILLLKVTLKPSKREGFSITPTYTSTDFQQTTVAPLFSEEWQIPPPVYDIYNNIPPPASFDEPLKPQSYPYGQYLTRTNLLPSDERNIHLLNGGTKQAREYHNSAFLRHELAQRENISRIYKKSIARRYKHLCNDSFSPYTSY